MLRYGAGLIGLLLPCAASAQQQAVTLHATYETYAAGIPVAVVETGFSLGPWNYQMDLAFHTTGMVGLLFRGHQLDRVSGAWNGSKAAPSSFFGQGVWHGTERLTAIDYQQGRPLIRQLQPPNDDEREPVPDPLQANSIDTLSALTQLIRVVSTTGRCETRVHTYDGRRAVEIEAHTVGDETLEPTGRSSFAGKTLRCDFAGQLLAGFKFGDDRARDSKPMHGSAWLAPVLPGGPPMPVRMAFETRWFGDATMYLTGIAATADWKIARGN
jgi:hypothetical protein